MPYVEMKGAMMNQVQASTLFAVPESARRPAPPPTLGFHFTADGSKIVAEVPLGASDEDLDAFRIGSAELRLHGHAMLCFGLVIRFRLEERATGWLRFIYSWPYDPDFRKATPVDAPNVRMLPVESRRLGLVLFRAGSREVVVARSLGMDPHFAWALDRRIQDTRLANQKPQWIVELTRILKDDCIPERIDPRVDVAGTAVDEPPSP
ncbi:MAG: hypothetical protein P4L85_02690 [Paludisphaera borealis]|uniref:hypothetical protein n=1 Tax=Paludisphaera borealis TaxID=1387353 RepID=UPI00283F7258|nr:hypothetical protein [Paludisphaera borealis]MDR3618229.1 hypothetical protein [Paludisphaera borealis]